MKKSDFFYDIALYPLTFTVFLFFASVLLFKFDFFQGILVSLFFILFLYLPGLLFFKIIFGTKFKNLNLFAFSVVFSLLIVPPIVFFTLRTGLLFNLLNSVLIIGVVLFLESVILIIKNVRAKKKIKSRD